MAIAFLKTAASTQELSHLARSHACRTTGAIATNRGFTTELKSAIIAQTPITIQTESGAILWATAAALPTTTTLTVTVTTTTTSTGTTAAASHMKAAIVPGFGNLPNWK